MGKICRPICVFLSVIILLFTALGSTFGVSAANVVYRVKGSNVNVREDATTTSKSLGMLSYVYVTKNGEKQGVDGKIWFNITYGEITGYIRSDFIEEITVVTDQSFEEQLKAFPDSYKDYLRRLHSVYPNWKFYADNIDMTLDEAAELELNYKQENYSELSWRHMGFGGYDWGSEQWTVSNGGWYNASREVIKYYMDPRNFLDASYIYTFLQQSYDPTTQDEAGLSLVVKGTFLEKGYSDPNDTAYGGSYIKVIMEAARRSGVSPYVLAATIIQEQGSQGTSELISGASGYYNFFNIKASGANEAAVIQNGLNYAKTQGWTTRSASIIGGASSTLKNYFDRGQNTYYYMNYYIVNGKVGSQYAQAVHNAASSGKLVSSTYADLKSAALSFVIPVYKNMPSEATAKPARNNNVNNYYFNSISATGLTPSFNRFTYSYDLRVSGDTTVWVTVPNGASYAGAASYQLKAGNNTVVLSVKSQTGYINNYNIYVNSDRDCTLYVDSSGNAPAVTNGDTNGDGKITLIDLANVQRHLLGLITLTGDKFTGADTNKDGKITLIDLANIQRHLLGLINLT